MEMRKYLFICTLVGICGCVAPSQNSEKLPPVVGDSLTLMSNSQDTFPSAICLWEKAGLRVAPGSNKNIEYITPILMGEKVSILGPMEKIAKENKTYIKVRLSDGKEGWVHRYLFGMDARSAVVMRTTNVYRRPDLLMLKPEKLHKGNFVIITDRKDNWVKVIGKEKKVVGWVYEAGALSEEFEDIRIAVLYERAKSEPELSRKVNLLEGILETAGENANFLDLIEEDLELNTKQLNTSQAAEALKITAQTPVISQYP